MLPYCHYICLLTVWLWKKKKKRCLNKRGNVCLQESWVLLDATTPRTLPLGWKAVPTASTFPILISCWEGWYFTPCWLWFLFCHVILPPESLLSQQQSRWDAERPRSRTALWVIFHSDLERSDNALLKFMHAAKTEGQHKLWKMASDLSRSYAYTPGM